MFRTFGVRPDSGKRVISPELEQGGLWKEKNVLTLATAGQKVVRVSLQWPTLFINQATRGLGLIDVALNKHLASVVVVVVVVVEVDASVFTRFPRFRA